MKRNLIIVAVVFIASVFVVFLTFGIPAEKEEQITYVSYTNTGNFNYLVNLKPSYLFGSGSGQTSNADSSQSSPKYPAASVDRFNFTFSYEFLADKPVESVVTQISAMAYGKDTTGSPLALELLATSQNNSPAVCDFQLMPAQFSGDIIIEIHVYAAVQTSIGPVFESFTQTLSIQSSGLLLEIDPPGGNSQEDTLGALNYTQKSNLTYSVVLNANSPMGAATVTLPTVTITTAPAGTVGPKDVVFFNLVDSMNMTFSYQLQSNKPVTDLSEQVHITAVLEGAEVWTKSIEIVPQTTKNGNFTVSFPVDLTGLLQLLSDIKRETGSAANSHTLTIRVNMRVTGQTEYGPIDDIFNPTLTTSLDKGLLQWTESLEQSETGTIQTRIMVPNPDMYLGMSVEAVKAVSIILMVAILGVLSFATFIYLRRRNVITVLSSENEAMEIQKKYGDRVAEVMKPVQVQGETIQLVSMEELIKIADELGKPVFHQSGENPIPIHTYYIIDGINRYVYTI